MKNLSLQGSEWFTSPCIQPSKLNKNSSKKPDHHENNEFRLECTPLQLRNYINPKNIFMTPKNIWDISPVGNFRQSPSSTFEDFDLPNMFANVEIHEHQIRQKIVYSDEEPETPSKNPRGIQPEDISSKYLNTTSKKYKNELNVQQYRVKERGLKFVAGQAYALFHEVKISTYKEISDLMLQNIKSQIEIEEDKDQQNIRRRVYDALNVMMAIGVLKKEGRKIVKNQHNPFLKILHEKAARLHHSIDHQSLRVQEKKIKLQQLLEKKEVIKNLLFRNRQKKSSVELKIRFPFIVTTTELFKDESKGISLTSNKVQIKAERCIFPLGDLDAIILCKDKIKLIGSSSTKEKSKETW